MGWLADRLDDLDQFVELVAVAVRESSDVTGSSTTTDLGGCLLEEERLAPVIQLAQNHGASYNSMTTLAQGGNVPLGTDDAETTGVEPEALIQEAREQQRQIARRRNVVLAGVVLAGVAVAGGHIYWTNGEFVGRANLDGTVVNRRFIRTAGGPCGVAVYRGHIYWGLSKGGLAHPSTTIGRANLNGSAVNDQFITGIHDECSGLAVG